MVVPRYRIETWSRPQLEDNFHNAIQELQNAQKRIKDQEKQLSTFNSRFRKNLLERKSRDEQMVDREKFENVVKENEILEMKLKATKHQLLLYTAPSARAATASAMTGRSTFRQPPSTWRHKNPISAGSIDRATTPVPIMKKNDRIQLGTQEKVTIIKLNRDVKAKDAEISELKWTIEKLKEQLKMRRSGKNVSSSGSSSSKSTSRNNEDVEISEMSDYSSATPIPEPIKENTKNPLEAAEKIIRDRLKVAENDLEILRQECAMLKNTNDRLVQQSLSKSEEYGARENIEDKKRIVELEEQLKESERRRKEDQKKYEEVRAHYKNKIAAASNKTGKSEEGLDTKSDSPPPIIYEPIRKRLSQNEIQRIRKSDDDLLDKLYKEVGDILVSHDVNIDEVPAGKWQKLYSEIYEELEKVRNMLVVQYDINQKQQSEINLLNEELERLRTINAEKILKAKELIDQKQKKIFMLEEQIKTIAYSEQKPIGLISDGLKIADHKETTDLSLKLISVRPSAFLLSRFFFSLEFFDFQLTTTPIMEPKQQSMDFTTVYDVVVSNLLIHYLQTSGIIIEMYKPGYDTYQLIGVATISLIPLFNDNVIQRFCSEIEFKSLESSEIMCTVQYEIEISKPFVESYKKCQKSEIAKSMIPLKIEEITNNDEQFEPLTIMINRILGLENIKKDPNVEFSIVYELLTFSPFFTDFSTSTEIRSKRDCAIPKNTSSRDLFSTTNISFYVVEQNSKEDGVLAILHLPLLPLCKPGGSIKGVFEMLDVKGENKLGVSLDITIIWKHQQPAFFVKPVPRGIPIEIGPEETPILAAGVLEKKPGKQFDVSVVREEDVQRILQSPTVLTPSVPSPRSVGSSSSSSSNDVFSPASKTDVFEFDLPESREENVKEEEEIESVSALSNRETIVERQSSEAEEILSSSDHSLSGNIIEEELVDPEKDQIRNLLGVLPPIAKPREKSLGNIKGVVFTDPLHNSVPPSDSSSTSSPRRSEKLPVAIPEFQGHGVIKVPKPSSSEDLDNLEPDCRVIIKFEKFEIVQFSRLLMKYYDHTKVVIDCGFLDIPVEEIRSAGFDLPRNANQSVDLDFQKELHLTKRQYLLLEQWIELSNRVDFTLISISPGEEEELAVAQLTLFRNNSNNKIVAIDFIDINGENLAELQLSLQYSPALLQRLK